MKVLLTDAGKRYNRDWIFRHLNYQFETGKSYAITGPNGSGKSTLLQVISGALSLNEGRITYNRSGSTEPEEIDPYTQIAYCAPYLELVEEMTAREFLLFHESFKPFVPGLTHAEILATVGLDKAVDKQIRNFSSGMKQRLKLAQAFFSNTPLLLLDEPCTNLDAAGIAIYQQLIEKFKSNRLLIISSNDKTEYGFCEEILKIDNQ